MLKKIAIQERLIGCFKTRRFIRNESGAALVEMTIALPFMLVIAAGVFEFSNLFYQKLLIEAGLRDAARYVGRCPVYIPSAVVIGFPCTVNTEAKAKNIAAYGSLAGITPRVAGWAAGDVAFNDYNTLNPILADGSLTYRGPAQIRTIRVTTTFTYTGVSLLKYIGLGNSITLSGAHEERYIGW